MQFTCESGRIVLCLRNHEWNKSAISSMFSQVASSVDFVTSWDADIISSSQPESLSDHRRSDPVAGDTSTRQRSSASTPDLSNSQDGQSERRRKETLSISSDRLTRKRPSTSAEVSSGTYNMIESDEILGGPSSSKKRCDYMCEGIDQRIEGSRKGIHAYKILF